MQNQAILSNIKQRSTILYILVFPTSPIVISKNVLIFVPETVALLVTLILGLTRGPGGS